MEKEGPGTPQCVLKAPLNSMGFEVASKLPTVASASVLRPRREWRARITVSEAKRGFLL